MATLEDIQLELEIANEEQDNFRAIAKSESLFSQEMQLEQLSMLQGIFGILKDSFDFDKLLALKASREQSGAETLEKPKSKSAKTGGTVELPSKLEEFLGAIAGLVAGFVSSLGLILAKAVEFFKAEAFFAKVFKPLKVLFETMGKALKGGTTKVVAELKLFFKNFGKIFKTEGGIGSIFLSEGTLLNQLGGLFGKAITKFKNGVKSFMGVLGKVGKELKAEGSIFSTFSKAITEVKALFTAGTKTIKAGGKVGKFLSTFSGFFKAFVDVGAKIGATFSKLLPPILIIMEVVEMIKTSFSFVGDEMDRGGNSVQLAIAGILGAFTGFVNFWLEIPDMIIDAVSWLTEKILGPENPITKFLDSFSLVELFTGFMKDVTNFINHPGETLIKALEFLKTAVTDAFDSLMEFDFAAAFANPVETVLRLLMMPMNLLKDAVAWVMGKLGFEEASEDLKNFDILDTIKTVINAPFVLLGKAVNWLMGFLGFEALKVDLEKIDVFATMSSLIMAPFNLLVKAIDWVLDLLGFDSLLSYMPDPTAILQSASDWLTGLIDGAIDWIKDKLSFFGGDSGERKDKQERKEMQKMAEQKGIVKKEGVIGFRKNTIDDETLRSLTDENLMQVSRAYADDEDLYPKLENEMERRKMEYRKMEAQKAPGTLQTALQPPEVVNEIDDKYANPAQISGLGQQSVAQTQELQVNQASYDQNKGPTQSQGNNITSVSAPTTNNTTNNNSYTQHTQPSTTDNSDQMYIFRATGTSR